MPWHSANERIGVRSCLNADIIAIATEAAAECRYLLEQIVSGPKLSRLAAEAASTAIKGKDMPRAAIDGGSSACGMGAGRAAAVDSGSGMRC